MLTNAIQHADQILDALGHQTRRDILALLREGPKPVGVIASRLPISRPAVSKHLQVLRAANLVGFDAQGRRNIFYIKTAGFHEASTYLAQFWDEALVNFQRVASETDFSEP